MTGNGEVRWPWQEPRLSNDWRWVAGNDELEELRSDEPIQRTSALLDALEWAPQFIREADISSLDKWALVQMTIDGVSDELLDQAKHGACRLLESRNRALTGTDGTLQMLMYRSSATELDGLRQHVYGTYDGLTPETGVQKALEQLAMERAVDAERERLRRESQEGESEE